LRISLFNIFDCIERLAGLVQKLDVPDPLDPAHTVLENTTILYTSELCDGSHASHARNISTAGGSRFTYYPMVLSVVVAVSSIPVV